MDCMGNNERDDTRICGDSIGSCIGFTLPKLAWSSIQPTVERTVDLIWLAGGSVCVWACVFVSQDQLRNVELHKRHWSTCIMSGLLVPRVFQD